MRIARSDLAPAPEETAEREVDLDRLAVDVQHAREDFDRPVGLLVDQVVEACKVVGREIAADALRRQATRMPSHQPADERRRPRPAGQ